MDITPELLVRHGYQPQENGLDKRPQLRALSQNTCPNAHPMWLTMSAACSPGGMTTWGYCNLCWEHSNVPAVWSDRVDRESGQ